MLQAEHLDVGFMLSGSRRRHKVSQRSVRVLERLPRRERRVSKGAPERERLGTNSTARTWPLWRNCARACVERALGRAPESAPERARRARPGGCTRRASKLAPQRPSSGRAVGAQALTLLLQPLTHDAHALANAPAHKLDVD